MNEVPIDNVLVNENPPAHNEEIEEEVENEDVEEIEIEEGEQRKLQESLPSIQC